MSFTYEVRLADSPFVRTIWRTRSENNDCYTTFADGSWDIILIKHDNTTKVLLGGPMSRATPIPYIEGSEYLGIRFKIGTFLLHAPASRIVDVTSVLPEVWKTSFWLGGSAWEIPTYENVEAFVARLVRRELLLSDRVVMDALLREEQTRMLSPRSVQRHFLKTAGLTQAYIRQIERATVAANLLWRSLHGLGRT